MVPSGALGFPAEKAIEADPVRWPNVSADRDVFERAFSGFKKCIMADTKKLSVEKALNKLREADVRQSKSTQRDEEIDALNEEIKRMRAQRLRLERPQRKKP